MPNFTGFDGIFEDAEGSKVKVRRTKNNAKNIIHSYSGFACNVGRHKKESVKLIRSSINFNHVSFFPGLLLKVSEKETISIQCTGNRNQYFFLIFTLNINHLTRPSLTFTEFANKNRLDSRKSRNDR